jgi:GTPase SAR1 family protein
MADNDDEGNDLLAPPAGGDNNSDGPPRRVVRRQPKSLAASVENVVIRPSRISRGGGARRETCQMTAQVLLLGAPGSGKSEIKACLERAGGPRRPGDRPAPPTPGVDMWAFSWERGTTGVKFVLYDASGAEVYESTARSYARQAEAVLVCCDLASDSAEASARAWMQRARAEHASAAIPRPPCYALVGTKEDLAGERRLSPEAFDSLAREMLVDHACEISARLGQGVLELFQWLSENRLEAERQRRLRDRGAQGLKDRARPAKHVRLQEECEEEEDDEEEKEDIREGRCQCSCKFRPSTCECM